MGHFSHDPKLIELVAGDWLKFFIFSGGHIVPRMSNTESAAVLCRTLKAGLLSNPSLRISNHGNRPTVGHAALHNLCHLGRYDLFADQEVLNALVAAVGRAHVPGRIDPYGRYVGNDEPKTADQEAACLARDQICQTIEWRARHGETPRAVRAIDRVFDALEAQDTLTASQLSIPVNLVGYAEDDENGALRPILGRRIHALGETARHRVVEQLRDPQLVARWSSEQEGARPKTRPAAMPRPPRRESLSTPVGAAARPSPGARARWRAWVGRFLRRAP